MKKKLFTTTKQYKGKAALEELKRAHIIIAILALALAITLATNSSQDLELNGGLVAVANILLTVVAVLSVTIALQLSKK